MVEDSDTSLEDLEKEGFPKNILNAINCLTKQKGESYDQFIDRICEDPIARAVKIEDIKDNMNLQRIEHVSDNDLQRLAKYHKALKKLQTKSAP